MGTNFPKKIKLLLSKLILSVLISASDRVVLNGNVFNLSGFN